MLNFFLPFGRVLFGSDGAFRPGNDLLEINMLKNLLPGPKVVGRRSQFQWLAQDEEYSVSDF